MRRYVTTRRLVILGRLKYNQCDITGFIILIPDLLELYHSAYRFDRENKILCLYFIHNKLFLPNLFLFYRNEKLKKLMKIKYNKYVICTYSKNKINISLPVYIGI